RAAEIRKRLAMHYVRHDDAHGAIRIEIPSGSYRAVFEMMDRQGSNVVHKLSGESVVSRDFPGDELVGNSAEHAGEARLRSETSRCRAGRESTKNAPKLDRTDDRSNPGDGPTLRGWTSHA